MKCILHIGTEKTGTTTIQNFLDINRESLKEQGFFVPPCMSMNQHWKLHGLFLTDDERLEFVAPENRASVLAEFKEKFIHQVKASDCNTVVMSSEFFHSRMKSVEQIQALKDFLSEFFDEIKIICYLRRQDKLALSHYSTLLKVGFTRQNALPNIKEAAIHYYDYNLLIGKWEKVFSNDNIVIEIFEKPRLKEGDIIDDFCDKIETVAHGEKIELGLLNRPKNLNASISQDAQLPYLFFNSIFEHKKHNQRPRFLFQRWITESFPGKITTDKKAAETFYNQFKKTNEYLFQRYKHFNLSFDEDFSSYPEQSPQQNLTEAMRMPFLFLKNLFSNFHLIEKQNLNQLEQQPDKHLLNQLARHYQQDHAEIAQRLREIAKKL